MALTLLLSTVSLLAHDSAQQPVTPASPISTINAPPLVAASPAQAVPGAAITTSGASTSFDAVAPGSPSIAIIDALDRQSPQPSTPAPETSVFTALPGRGAVSIPAASTPATPPPAHPGMLGSGAVITPSAVSSAPITLAAASSAAVQLAAHPRLILDTNTLTTLRQSAANNSAQWQTLKAT
ncbi:hypothetical protein HDE77_004110, partial [Rhodanobacter sp. MP7CTX1]|nr:hypothetical protein [Rhodanobacter sp. MP7CTX1]